MSKSLRKRRDDDKKIHRVGKQDPGKEIDQELKRINNVEDLEHTALDEVLETSRYTNIH